jgi:diguanylate cyclase (GGDEF)-like protein/PAS domain S-box-containing protein
MRSSGGDEGRMASMGQAAEALGSGAAVPVLGAKRVEGEPQSVLALIAFSLAALYLVELWLTLWMLSGRAALVMATLCGVSSIGLANAGWLIRRSSNPVAPRWVAAVASVPIMTSIVHFAVTGRQGQTTTLMLAIVAIGAGIASRRAAMVLITVGCAAWAGVAAVRLPGPGLETADVARVGLQLAAAVGLSAALHVARTRREHGLRQARDVLAAGILSEQAAHRARAESEQRYHGLFDDSPVGIGLSDEHGLLVAANPALCELFGRPLAEVLGRSAVEFTHPDDKAAHSRAYALITEAPTGVVRVEKRYLRPDGRVCWAWLTARHTPGPNGETWTLAHIQDVTERKRAEQAIADSEANLSALAEVTRRIQRGEDARALIVDAACELAGATHASLAELDASGNLVVTASTNDALVSARIPLSATSAAVTVVQSGEALFIADPDQNPLVKPGMLRLTAARSVHLLPVQSRERITGVLVVGWDHRVEGIRPAPGRALKLLADETGIALEQDALMAELKRRAVTDTLTGLPNRRGWEDSMRRLLEDARRRGTPLTIAIADVDHFKAYNDTHGHLAGDNLLRAFATNTRRGLRGGDVVARWGGEEFTIALPDCSLTEARLVLARVHAAMPDGQTCSIGFATWDTAEMVAELMSRADEALYAAKSGGRNRSTAYVEA